MKVLVAYASRHGATKGIAERIAQSLTNREIEVTLKPARQVQDVAEYDAFVVGGAAYAFHWLKDASTFVRRNRVVLAGNPTWLFSSGPLGTDTVDQDRQRRARKLRPQGVRRVRARHQATRRAHLLRRLGPVGTVDRLDGARDEGHARRQECAAGRRLSRLATGRRLGAADRRSAPRLKLVIFSGHRGAAPLRTPTVTGQSRAALPR